MKNLRSGRGPTRLMSPFSTFHNCGNSSIRYLRMVLPNGVMRSSFSEERRGVPFSAFSIIERNLIIENKLPFSPTLSCRKNMLPLEERLTFNATTSKIGESSKSPKMEINISASRFVIFSQGVIRSVGISIKGEPKILCVLNFPERISSSSGSICTVFPLFRK